MSIIAVLLLVSLIFAILAIIDAHPKCLPISWAFAVGAALVAVWR